MKVAEAALMLARAGNPESTSALETPRAVSSAPVPTGWDAERTASGFHHILVCLDGSGAAEASLPLALHLAGLDGAQVTLLHVLETTPDPKALQATDAIAWEVAREEARRYLAGVAERFKAEGISVEVRLAEGPTPREVSAVAALSSVDLTVLSTHGTGGEGTRSLGATARKILELGQGALLLVPSQAVRVPISLPLRRLFVPLDGSMRAECVLPTTLRLARAEQAEVILAHVSTEPIRTEVLCLEEDLALARELADRLAARSDAYLAQVQARIVDGGSRARTTLCRSTDHRAGLVMLAAREQPDLVVLSAHGEVCNARRRFGSVTSYFIANSSAPLLVFQDLPSTGRGPLSPSTRPPSRSMDDDTGG